MVYATDQDFPIYLANQTKVMVMFSSRHCGACTYVKPYFDILNSNPQFTGIHFLRIDADANPQAKIIAEVDGLPYFAVFHNNQFIDGRATTRAEALAKLCLNLLNL